VTRILSHLVQQFSVNELVALAIEDSDIEETLDLLTCEPLSRDVVRK